MIVSSEQDMALAVEDTAYIACSLPSETCTQTDLVPTTLQRLVRELTAHAHLDGSIGCSSRVMRAVRVLTDPQAGVRLKASSVTVSTVGLVPQIERFCEDAGNGASLAISLHAVTDTIRDTVRISGLLLLSCVPFSSYLLLRQAGLCRASLFCSGQGVLASVIVVRVQDAFPGMLSGILSFSITTSWFFGCCAPQLFFPRL